MKKANIENMELGNLLFGHSRGAYHVLPRNEYEDVVFKLLDSNNFDSYGYKQDIKERVFENDTFIIGPYYWGEDEEETSKPNFVYKPTGLEIKWYKYPLRDAYCNQNINIQDFKLIIDACNKSLKA